MIENLLVVLGIGISLLTLGAIIWSIKFPEKSLWPPKTYTIWTPYIIWAPTFVLFGTMIALGVMGWGQISIPLFIKYGIGSLLILVGNGIVWFEVFKFGVAQTGGAVGKLKTDGLYRFSRNPQYVGDILMILGWVLVSAAPFAILVGMFAVTVLIAAPFSEEPWLKKCYGADYEHYLKATRRFF